MGYIENDLMKLFIRLLEQAYESTSALLKPYTIDFSNPPVRLEPLVTTNNVVIASPTNTVCITKSEGSGKSNYISALIAGTLNCTDTIESLGTCIAANVAGKALLVYDTEQTEDQLYRNLRNVLKRAKIDTPQSGLKRLVLPILHEKRG